MTARSASPLARGPVVLIAEISPAPERDEEIIAALAEGVERVHGEDPGCLVYALHRDGDRLVMIEKWADEETFTRHRISAAVDALSGALEGLLAEETVLRILAPLPLGLAQGRL